MAKTGVVNRTKCLITLKGVTDKKRNVKQLFVPGIVTQVDSELWNVLMKNKLNKSHVEIKNLVVGTQKDADSLIDDLPDGFKETNVRETETEDAKAARKKARKDKKNK